MNDAEARKLLIDAGVAEVDIDQNAINLTSAICDALAIAFARRVAKRVAGVLLPLIENEEKFREKCRELGIIIH